MKIEELNYGLPKETINEDNWNVDEWRENIQWIILKHYIFYQKLIME